MNLKKAELEAMADRWEKRAQKALLRYQESDQRRYLREKENAEDLADALRMAANAEEDHSQLVSLRGMLAGFGMKAARICEGLSDQTPDKLAEEIAACARMYDLIPAKGKGTIG